MKKINFVTKFIARRQVDIDSFFYNLKERRLIKKGELLSWDVQILCSEFEKCKTKKISVEEEEKYLESDLFVGAAYYPKKFSILDGEIGFDLITNTRLILVD